MTRKQSLRAIAEPNTVLRGLVGSSGHGLVLSGTDDRDEMGVCLEPRRYVVGFAELERLAPAFALRQAGKRFLGYLEAQRLRLVGERGPRDVNRTDLVDRFGYDTKYAMHMLRLGHQGVEFMETGRLSLPMREPVRSHLMDVRSGRSDLPEVLTECTELESRLNALLNSSLPPPEPDRDRVERFVMDAYARAWTAQEA
jgi:hypothetical protein